MIRSVNMNTLQVSPDNSDTVLKLDMSSVPCHFSGGIAAGAHARYYLHRRIQRNHSGWHNCTGNYRRGNTGTGQQTLHFICSLRRDHRIHCQYHYDYGPDGISLTFFTDTARTPLQEGCQSMRKSLLLIRQNPGTPTFIPVSKSRMPEPGFISFHPVSASSPDYLLSPRTDRKAVYSSNNSVSMHYHVGAGVASQSHLRLFSEMQEKDFLLLF